MESSISSVLESLSEPRQTAYEAVLSPLREGILSGRLPGGTRLVQADLASHFGVSNTPVREALRQLASEGLVQFDSYRGAEVLTPTQEDTEEIYEVLVLLEPEVARRAATHITDEELARLTAIHDEMRATSDPAEWVPLNRNFHDLIHEAADSPRLAGMLRGLVETSTLRVAVGVRAGLISTDRSNKEHARLVKALAKHDASRAAAEMQEHLEGTLQAVRETSTLPSS